MSEQVLATEVGVMTQGVRAVDTGIPEWSCKSYGDYYVMQHRDGEVYVEVSWNPAHPSADAYAVVWERIPYWEHSLSRRRRRFLVPGDAEPTHINLRRIANIAHWIYWWPPLKDDTNNGKDGDA